MSSPEILVHADGDAVAEAVAHRLGERLAELQAAEPGYRPQVSLTGGRIALAAYRRLAADGPSSGTDWSAVDLWWSDERFVPADSPDRNDTDTVAALADLGLAPDQLHRMPTSDDGLDLDAAAAAYAQQLGDRTFDVTLLGVGPDGHVASVFPGHPSAEATGIAVPVRESPKPPPDRISLTLEALDRSTEVWFCVSGEDKAEAVALALTESGDDAVPAGRVTGTERTLWLLDEAAASTLPPTLRSLP